MKHYGLLSDREPNLYVICWFRLLVWILFIVPQSKALIPPHGLRYLTLKKHCRLLETSSCHLSAVPILDPIQDGPGVAAEDNHDSRKRSKYLTYYLNQTYIFWEENMTLQSFNMDLLNLASEDPQKAKDALEIMADMFERGLPSTVEPDCRCYNTLIDGFLRVGDLKSAQAILERMEQLADKRENATMAPSEFTYMIVTEAWANDDEDDFSGKSADQAERIMRRMQERGWEPNVKVWSIVLEGWCKRAGIAPRAMKRAQDLLAEMEQAAKVGSQSTTNKSPPSAPPPNIVTYTSYIGGLARSKERTLARQADATLVRMERAGVKPDVVAYTCVLNCWAKTGNRREREMAASRALRILAEMEKRYAHGDFQAKPNIITYSTAIRAIGNSLDSDAAERAEGVLRHMYELYHQTPNATSSEAEGQLIWRNPKPTTAIYNAVIDALSRAPCSGNKGVQIARKAEEYLAEMYKRSAAGEGDVHPDVRTWGAVLRSWAMSGAYDAAENAQRVLHRLEFMHKEGKSLVRPNNVCYTTVMTAWSKSRRTFSLEKLEAILRKMENHFTETQEADMRPNTASYVTAIHAFIRKNEFNAAQRAQATVDRMMRLYAKGLGHVRPTRIVFNALIHAWSKCSEPGSAQRSEGIFKWMEAQYQAGDHLLRPDQTTVGAVLNAWANHPENGGAERAQQIFEHMQSLTLQERGFPLSIIMPNIVIKAIARSKEKDAVSKAERILIKLENDFFVGRSTLRPDVTTYSSVINCCAHYPHPEGKAQALEVALRTFRKLCDLDGDGPNNITFGTLFKAIANIMPPGEEREELVRSLFHQCSEEGFVDAFVLSQVRTASPQLYRDLTEKAGGTIGPRSDNETIKTILESIPTEWSANVVC